MSGLSDGQKRRAARAAVIGLLGVLLCRIGVSVALWQRDDALHPRLDLEALAQQLRQKAFPGSTSAYLRTADQHDGETGQAVAAYQAMLETIITSRQEIVAAVVAGPDNRILAAYPKPEKLVGQQIGPRVPALWFRQSSPSVPREKLMLRRQPGSGSRHTPVVTNDSGGPPSGPAAAYVGPGNPGMPGGPPGAPYSSGGGLGYADQPWRYPTDAYGSGGPYGPYGSPGGPGMVPYGGPPGYGPAGSSPSGIDAGRPETLFAPGLQDPMTRSLYALLTRAQIPDWPALDTDPVSVPLFIVKNQIVDQLYVVPRTHQTEYAIGSLLYLSSQLGTVFFFLLYWLALPWWVFLDARRRTEKAVPMALFVLLTNFLGWLSYLVIRPEQDRLCPVCVSLMEPGFRCCPHCGWSSKARCRQCGRPARSDWRFCPYCEAPRAGPEPANVQS